VAIAVSKATHDAYKNVKDVIINDKGTVPYLVEKKFKSAIIRLIPAVPGTGLKAGSSVRNVLELAGYTNILSKIIGTNNRLNNALLAIEILSTYKKFTKNKGYHISGLALSQSSPAFEEAVVEETEAE
jgi:small subunit ribosomal protein S5